MTTAYNKRPSARGRVRESSKTAPAYIEWCDPKSIIGGILRTIMGVAPIVALAFFPWFVIGDDERGEVPFLMLDFLKAPFLTIETLTTSLDGLLNGNDMDVELMLWFSTFSFVFLGFTALFALSVALPFLSLVTGKGRIRGTLSYLGFAAGIAAPVVLIGAIHIVNNRFEDIMMTATVFPYAAVLVSLIAMIYCVRFPVMTTDMTKRNSALTKIVTSFVPVKNDGVREGVRKVIFTTALICFVYYGSTLGVDLFNLWRSDQMRKTLIERQNTIVNLHDKDFDSIRDKNPKYSLDLWRQNNDTIGFLSIGDTAIQYPVVQSNDNRYYLGRDFYKNDSRAGWIFADHRNKFGPEGLSGNTVLYGHSGASRDQFFTLIPQYFETARVPRQPNQSGDMSFYKKNSIIKFGTLYEQAEWVVFATGLYNTQSNLGTVFPYYVTHDFANEEAFNNYIVEVMDRSVIFTDVDLKYGDNILTLSTCHFVFGKPNASTRAVVFARKLRPGETASSFDPNSVQFNNQAYFGDFPMAAKSPSFNEGRRGVWDREKYLG